MTSVWILHRDAHRCAAIGRLAGVGAEAVTGSPREVERFAAAPPPRVVVMGLAGDLESELEFAHRLAPRMPGARWILLAEPSERSEAERLFDALSTELLPDPPPAEALRARVRAALRARPAERLSDRRQRDALSERFSRWFHDLELPDLLRGLDPRLAGVPLLVRGERGTGRALLAQYVHTFGGSAGGGFAFVPCGETRSSAALLAALRAESEGPADRLGLAVCLEDADRLPSAVQQELRRWIEFGPPGGSVRATRLRWMATCGDDEDGALAPGLAAELAQALAGISIRIPPLRERSAAVERFAAETARTWCAAHGETPPELGADALEVLREHPWPGNLRELEAVVVRSLAAGSRSPLGADALRFDHGAPLAAAAPGEMATPEAPPTEAAHLSTPAAEPEAAAPPVEAPDAPGLDVVRQLARALTHELRNPLVSIRTFAELLPERFDDPEFRERFRATMTADVGRIERVARRLGAIAEIETGEPERVDVTAMLERVLDERRGELRSRGLGGLKELEVAHPDARGRAAVLGFVFDAILDRCLAWIPDRGDLFLASKHHPEGLRGGPSLRVLARFQRSGAGRSDASLDVEAAPEVSDQDVALELVLAELLLRAEGGALAVSDVAGDETVIVADLPAF